MDATWLIVINGCSTGCPPIHVSVRRSAMRTQNRIWLMGRNIMLCCLEMWSRRIIARTRIETTSASTPLSLFGIERRMA